MIEKPDLEEIIRRGQDRVRPKTGGIQAHWVGEKNPKTMSWMDKPITARGLLVLLGGIIIGFCATVLIVGAFL